LFGVHILLNRLMYVETIASQKSVDFWDTVYIAKLQPSELKGIYKVYEFVYDNELNT